MTLTMPQTERAVLALIIKYQDLAPILFENLSADDFELDEKIVFQAVQEHLEKKLPLDFEILADLLRREVNPSYVASMMESLLGTPPTIARHVLEERITFLKAEKAKYGLLQKIDECAKQARAVDIDFDEIIELAQKAKLVQTKTEDPSFDFAYQQYLESKRAKPTRISTGFPTFDKLTDDFQPGEIITVMARTVVGKTWLAINILHHLLAQTGGDDIGFFSMEMVKSAIVERMLQVHFGLSRQELCRQVGAGLLNAEGFLERYRALKVYGLVYSAAEIERLIRKDKLKVVFIDFLQLMRAGSGDGAYEVTTNKIVDLKTIAKNNGVTIFLVVQTSRKGAGGWEAVEIDMARESGAIEELSDFIIGAWDPSLRPGLSIDQLADFEGKLSLRLLKNKRGRGKFIEASFCKESGRIIEIETT